MFVRFECILYDFRHLLHLIGSFIVTSYDIMYLFDRGIYEQS